MASLKRQVTFWVRISGWVCLFPALILLQLYQLTQGIYWLFMLVVVVLFAAYLLATAKEQTWCHSDKLLHVIVFSLFFVAMLPAIPLLIAFIRVKKYESKPKN